MSTLLTPTRPLTVDRPLTARERKIIEDITRREFIIGGTALAALVAAGCGNDEGADGNEAAAGETRTFTDDAGATVEVPISPQRVAFLGYETLVTAVWLGYVPAALGWHTQDTDPVSYLQDQFGASDELAGVTELGDVFSVNVEAVAEVAPDLIVAETWMEPSVYEQLRQIAPVVRFDFRVDDSLVPQRAMAQLLGIEEAFDAKVAEYERRIDALRESHGDLWPDLEFVIVDQYSPADDNVYYAQTSPYTGFTVLTALGARQSRSVEELVAGQEYVGVSVEEMATYDADLLVLTTPDLKPLDPAAEVVVSSTFAARADQVLHVDTGKWSASNLPGLFAVLDDLDALVNSQQVDNSGDFD